MSCLKHKVDFHKVKETVMFLNMQNKIGNPRKIIITRGNVSEFFLYQKTKCF
jgi:hypothetical protein